MRNCFLTMLLAGLLCECVLSGHAAFGQNRPAAAVAVPADSSRNRISPALMTDVAIHNVAELTRFLASPQTNKRAVLTGTYDVGPNGLQRTGAWTNVLLTSAKGATLQTSGTTVLLFQGNQPVNRVKLENLIFRSTSTGGGYPLLFSNELVSFHGWEIARCQFIGTGRGHYNAFGLVQYSTVSQSGGSSSDLYIHDCSFLNIPRMGMEILSQGYDKVRLTNLTIARNRFENQTPNADEEHRMATSLSGLITNVYHGYNRSVNAKNIAYEFVNVKNALADNNQATATLETAVGYSITDDGRHTTEGITVRGGRFSMSSRPFQVYGAKAVQFIGGTYIGHRGVDLKCQHCRFDGLNITVHSTSVESSWQFGSGSSDNWLTNSIISSFGATKAGYHPAFESVVLRAGTANNRLIRVTTRLGKKADGIHYTDGRIQNQGEASNLIQNAVVQLE